MIKKKCHVIDDFTSLIFSSLTLFHTFAIHLQIFSTFSLTLNDDVCSIHTLCTHTAATAGVAALVYMQTSFKGVTQEIHFM